jgi:hypothetical protein
MVHVVFNSTATNQDNDLTNDNIDIDNDNDGITNCHLNFGNVKITNLTSGSISIGDYSSTFNGYYLTLLQSVPFLS